MRNFSVDLSRHWFVCFFFFVGSLIGIGLKRKQLFLQNLGDSRVELINATNSEIFFHYLVPSFQLYLQLGLIESKGWVFNRLEETKRFCKITTSVVILAADPIIVLGKVTVLEDSCSSWGLDSSTIISKLLGRLGFTSIDALHWHHAWSRGSFVC
jgi:hypothetical protein